MFHTIRSSPGVVMILGASDSGKTTWVAAAAQWLNGAGAQPVAIVDADIGQASIGPPTCVALSVVRHELQGSFALASLPCERLVFVGSVSPIGHLLQLAVSTKRLVEGAKRSGAELVLVDTTGFIEPGAGFQLKFQKIELLEPSHLVVLQHEAELEPLLSVVSGWERLCIHRLKISPLARRRTAAERVAYRAARFAAYFARAQGLVIPANQVLVLASPTGRYRLSPAGGPDLVTASVLREQRLEGLLIGLNTAVNETLGLGLLESVSDDGQEIRVRTPVTNSRAIRILQLGNLSLGSDGHHG